CVGGPGAATVLRKFVAHCLAHFLGQFAEQVVTTRLGRGFRRREQAVLILFGERAPDYQAAASQETPFALTGPSTPHKTTAKARPGQQRFRFQVLAKYGCKCSVCTITHPSLMKAALCGKAHNGSDDWRNGLPLCSTHHDAFDAHLFTINPETLAIETMPSVSPTSIGITTKSLTPIHQHPHPEALSWRFTQTNRLWAAQDLIAAHGSERTVWTDSF